MRRTLGLIVLLLVLPSMAWAQPEIVAQVKADLTARGVSLADSCGGFAITKRVAWRLRASGIGLVSKPSGNNCEGFSVDVLMYPDGRAFDILSDAGGANGPAWGAIEPIESSRWRPPVDPGDGAAPTPSVPSSPAPVVVTQAVDLVPVYGRFDQQHDQAERMFADLVARLNELQQQNEAIRAQMKQHDENPSFIGKLFGSRYTQILMGAAAAWLTASQTGK